MDALKFWWAFLKFAFLAILFCSIVGVSFGICIGLLVAVVRVFGGF